MPDFDFFNFSGFRQLILGQLQSKPLRVLLLIIFCLVGKVQLCRKVTTFGGASSNGKGGGHNPVGIGLTDNK